MKLVYITNARIPTEKAHGIQIANNCSAFAKNGAEVVLVIPRRKNIIKEDCFEFYNLKDKFQIVELPVLDFMNWKILPQRFSFNVVRFCFIFFGVLYSLFFTNKNDVIYTRSKKIILPLSLIRKNIYFEANDELLKDNFMSKIIVDRSKGIIVVNNRLKEKYKELFAASKGKILVARNGIDLKRFDIQCSKLEARNKLSLPQNKKIILYSGHLYKWKGVQTLINSSKYLDEKHLIVLVGGTENDVRELRIENKGLRNISIIGYKPYEEIPYWLKAADVLVLPNSGQEEILKRWTSPLKLFEYMAAKRSIVASDLPSIREILNEQNSVLVKPDDSQELAQGIKKLLQDNSFAERLSDKAFQNVRQNTWQNRSKHILTFCNFSC